MWIHLSRDQCVPLNHRLHDLNAVEGQFIPWPAALPQACHQGTEMCLHGTGLPLVPSSNSCCAGDISQLLSAGKCKHGPGLYLARDVDRGLLGAGGWRLGSGILAPIGGSPPSEAQPGGGPSCLPPIQLGLSDTLWELVCHPRAVRAPAA